MNYMKSRFYLSLCCICVFFPLQMAFTQVAAPTDVVATGYDSHVELQWAPNAEPTVRKYGIYVSEDNGDSFQLLKKINSISTSYIHFTGRKDAAWQYKITAEDNQLNESPFSASVLTETSEFPDEALLEMVQAYTFRYFWDFAHPVSGMARERNTTSIVTSGGSGFGLMAILVGIERGFISREQGITRLQKILDFLERADRFHGVYPHWMNGATGRTIPFSSLDDGADLVETAFLMQGLLTVRAYLDENTSTEAALQERITALWEAVEWDWFYQNGVLLWHWSPNYDFAINLPIRGYNEALIIYLLAIASPTHSIPAQAYHTGWAGGNYTNGTTFFGITLDVGPLRGGPLFFAHYSFLGFDPRGKKDAYTNYFTHNTKHTLSNRAYCILNTGNYVGYSEECWGLTASDNPFGYLAHEPSSNRDNGTITPTAALSSMPYTPTESLAALKHFYRELGERLWGVYGFYDAFNLTEDWFATSYLAIDQGPILGMIENYRTGLLWEYFMQNQEVQPALDAIGFVPDSTDITSVERLEVEAFELIAYPNPVSDVVEVTSQEDLRDYRLYDTDGRLIQAHEFPSMSFKIPVTTLPDGLYLLQARTQDGRLVTRKIIVQH